MKITITIQYMCGDEDYYCTSDWSETFNVTDKVIPPEAMEWINSSIQEIERRHSVESVEIKWLT